MKTLPAITMKECRIKTNMYSNLLFTVALPYYTHREYNRVSQVVILPTGSHLSFGYWEGGIPTVLVNGHNADKLMKALRRLKDTGYPFNETPPEWFLAARMVEQAKEDMEFPRTPEYVVKLKDDSPREMGQKYQGHPERNRIWQQWKGAWVKPYGTPLANGAICIMLHGCNACSTAFPDEFEEPLDMGRMPKRA